tara:strand:+ start:431 stop:1765 length:1335 start_codon:yes stop_codon:yes gene_type:complete
MKFLISVILTACIFGLTFSDPEKVTKSPQIETNNSESEWLSDTDLNLKVKKEEKLVLADVLEVGMSKYFYLVDGNRIRGVITKIDNQDCSIQTAEGILIVPMSDILEETIDLIKLDDTRYKGPLLREDAESLLIRSKYGDVTIMKKEVLKMERYHGGKLAPAIESRRTFDQGEDELISQFWDSNAFILEPNTFLLTPISLGYGFTDRFMISTRWSSNFNGDINLLPKIRLWHKKESTKESGLTLGLGIHQEYPLQTAISKFSHAYVNAAGESLNDSDISDDAFYDAFQDGDNVLFEGYLVYSTKRKNPTGRGKVGWSVGVKTSNMINHLEETIDVDNVTFTLSDDDKYKIPIRVYGLFHYDLQKNIKFVASMAYDNSYRELEFDKSTEDFFGNVGDAFTFDSFRGELAEFSFDFGFMYAVNDNFRIGVHFQQPYIDFHWEFFEF